MSRKEKTLITKQHILNHLDENEIDLSMSEISIIPVKELALVTRGTRLDLSRNHLKFLPDDFGTLSHLVGLDLSNNELTHLPNSFCKLLQLQKLDLYSNQLTTLPANFWHLKKLRWLDLKNNPLEARLKEAAGTCVSAAECSQCATKVIQYMKQQSSGQERQRQIELEKQREQERLLQEQRELAKKEKELRRRKKKEMEAERRQKEKEMEEAKLNVSIPYQQAMEERQSSLPRSPWLGVGCVCTSLVLISVIIILLMVLGLMLCPYFMNSSTCQSLRMGLIKRMATFLESFGTKLD